MKRKSSEVRGRWGSKVAAVEQQQRMKEWRKGERERVEKPQRTHPLIVGVVRSSGHVWAQRSRVRSEAPAARERQEEEEEEEG